MINDSVANPLQQALVTALRGNAPLQTYLHERPADAPDAFARVYDEGAVPADLVGRWVTVGDVGESWSRWFGRSGSFVGVTLNIWHTPVDGDDVGKAVTLELWRLVGRVLSQPLALTGSHLMLYGYADLTTVTRDPDGQSWHAVARYMTTTQRTATA